MSKVQQGFIRSTPPHDNYSEAVIVHFDPALIERHTLIEIHLRSHASMSAHSMRDKYRSAIYSFNNGQHSACQNILAQLQPLFDKPLITATYTFKGFKASAERFQNYYLTDPTRPFCTTHIEPKLKMLREKYSAQLTGNKNTDSE